MTTREFTFPFLDYSDSDEKSREKRPRRGIFLFEFVGGGKRIRTAVRRGKLRLTSRISPENFCQEVQVLDEYNEIVKKDVVVNLDGLVMQPDPETGIINVPFSDR